MYENETFNKINYGTNIRKSLKINFTTPVSPKILGTEMFHV